MEGYLRDRLGLAMADGKPALSCLKTIEFQIGDAEKGEPAELNRELNLELNLE